ncbi:MAG: hypothetical protein RR393_07990 [Bacteroidales bacterium]
MSLDIIQILISFVLGGGLSTILSVRYIRKENKRNDRTQEFDSLRKIVSGLQEEINFLQKKLNGLSAVWDEQCHNCGFRKLASKSNTKTDGRVTHINKKEH